MLDIKIITQHKENLMGFFSPAEYKIGRRFHYGNSQVIEITGRRKDGAYSFSYVDQKTGYLKKGFGGTITPPKPQPILKNNPENPMVLIIDEEAEYERSLKDPDDDIITVGEYDDSIIEEGDEPVTPYDTDAPPINQRLATAGTVVKALGKVAIVGGTVGMMTAGFLIGPIGAFAIALSGMFTFLGSDFLGNRMQKKAGVIQKKIYMDG